MEKKKRAITTFLWYPREWGKKKKKERVSCSILNIALEEGGRRKKKEGKIPKRKKTTR